MRHEKLIRTSLERIHAHSQGVDEQRVKYAKAALHHLDALKVAIDGSENVTELVDLIMSVNVVPEEIGQEEQEGYALFIHKIFKEGECHEMAQEDPLAASILMNGALHALKKSVIDDGKFLLLPQAIDLMMLGTMAQLIGGSKDIARLQLVTLLDVAINDDVVEAFGHHVPEAMKGVLPARVLPKLITLADLFQGGEGEEAVMLFTAAHSLLKKMLEDRLQYPGTSAEYVGALVALADFYMAADAQQRAFDMVYKAIDVIDEDLKYISFSAAYCYSAALVYQKRAEMAIMEDSFDGAQGFLRKGVEFINQAIKSRPTNTHYEDLRAEILNQLGIVYGMEGNIPKAQNVFLETIDCRRRMVEQSEQYKVGLIGALNNMATLLARFGNFKAALVYGDECLEIMESIDEVDRSPGYRSMLKSLRRSRDALRESLHPAPIGWRNFNDPEQFGPN